MTWPLDLLIVAAALGSGLTAGVFFTFSNFVMQALAQLDSPDGIAAMQSINVTVLNPLFFLAFLGTGVVCLAVAAFAIFAPASADPDLLLVGSVVYLVGSIVVTGTRNVPLNNRLAEVEPASPEAATVWADYLTRWTRWNHVRTVACFVAAACFTLA